MRRYKGSFTLEASYILPIILLCICIVIGLGASLHKAVCMQVEMQSRKEMSDVIAAMYRYEYIEGLFGEWDED